MKAFMQLISICVLILLLGGCATVKNTYILAPHPTGNVGTVGVANTMGSGGVSGAGETVLVDKAGVAPRLGGTMDKAKVDKMFAKALAAEPPQPKVFLLYFKSESADPDKNSMTLLDSVVQEVKNTNSLDVGITGHTDRSGEKDYNMDLSLKRAQEVQRLLVDRGIPVERFNIEYSGEGDLLVPTADNVHEPRNRRVEVVVR
jgi:outer membrane protein OmpA-like peptidoglycan-associated protein